MYVIYVENRHTRRREIATSLFLAAHRCANDDNLRIIFGRNGKFTHPHDGFLEKFESLIKSVNPDCQDIQERYCELY